MLGRPSPRLRNLPLNALAPNILTTLALCSGLTSIRFALDERWQLAVTAILVAGVFDALDGRVARLLKGATKFGAELDSLSDFLCFGVSPVVLIYLWSLHQLGNFGWLAVLVFAVAMALRLARFNTALDDPNRPLWMANFFTGVPAPAGAAVVMLPIMLSFAVGETAFRSPWLSLLWCCVAAFLSISKLPTFSGKKIKVPREVVLPLLLIVGLVATLLATEPWITLSVVVIIYLCLIPFSWRAYRRAQAEQPYPPAQPPSAAVVEPPPPGDWPDGPTPPGITHH